jgi:hypothetical protein
MRAPQPSVSDEQRILLALQEQLDAERAAQKEREAAEKTARMQETLVYVLPPRRTQESIEHEQEKLRQAAEAESSSCVVQ